MEMKTRFVRNVLLGVLAGSALLATASDGERLVVPVAFGRGLNTAQPGNEINHAILPQAINVAEGGVLSFVVSGFHQIRIYKDARASDIHVPLEGVFVNDPNMMPVYDGMLPAGGPTGLPVVANPSNANNRVESVTLTEPGTYLVICNVRQHFIDGMHGTINVTPRAGELVNR
jgi:plastocyanin